MLLAGSTASKEFRKYASEAIKHYRRSLEQDGAIVEGEKEDEQLAVRDYPCDSPSRAGAIVSGGNTAGPIRWKYNGRTLKELERL